MAALTDLPAWLTDSDIAYLTDNFDAYMNSCMLLSQLFGIYTGILTVTMWNVVISKSPHIGWPMVVVIILLYISTFVDFIIFWDISTGSLLQGQNIWTRYMNTTRDHNTLRTVGSGIVSIICSILADSAMLTSIQTLDLALLDGLGTALLNCCTAQSLSSLWYCLVFRTMDIYIEFMDAKTPDLHNLMLYATFSLATTIWCTLLIIYRILSVGWVNRRAGGGLRAYQHVIEVLVESSALYSICLILYVACFASNSWGQDYADVIASTARGIAPTLLIGRVAAGHARSDNSWHGSIASSLRFGQGQSLTSTQDSTFSINLDDPEAQVEQTDEADSEYVHQTSSQRVRVSSDDELEEAQLQEVEIGHEATPRPVVQG